jgi:phosphatidylinositol-3,4,5-trisphosphate 3-phosphatase/dual-specificity protein phosphatase PTEN
MRELGTVKKHLVKFASKAIERAASARKKSTKGTVSTTTSYIADSSKVAESQEKERELGKGLVWVSLARYDDEFVQTLERWERWTRERDESSGDGNATGKARLGVMRKGSERMSVGRAESASETGGEGEEETTLRDMFKDGKWDGKKMVRSFARMGNVEGKKRKETSEVCD